MEKVCDNCGEEYEVYSIVGLEDQTDLCKVCRFDGDCGRKGKMVLCKDERCLPCYERSFLSNERSGNWDCERNNKMPRFVFKNSHKKWWFKCDNIYSDNINCGHSFEVRLYHVNNDSWCSYCGRQKLCENLDCIPCYNNSFASNPNANSWDYNKNGISPRYVFKNSSKKYWFKCEKNVCEHRFEMKLHKISSSGQWCQFCSNKKLCEDPYCVPCNNKSFNSEEKSEFWDYEKNDKNPRDVFKNSHKKYWFKCKEKHSFDMNLSNISCHGNWCRFCKHKTERKFANWLEDEKYSFEREKKFPWCKDKTFLPFDFVLEREKIIIEIDGLQHFEQVMNWKCPKLTQERDIFKQNKALENGYTLIRLLQEDVLRKSYWKEELNEKIYLRDDPELIFICENNEYDSTHSSKVY